MVPSNWNISVAEKPFDALHAHEIARTGEFLPELPQEPQDTVRTGGTALDIVRAGGDMWQWIGLQCAVLARGAVRRLLAERVRGIQTLP